ncbi:MAG: phosphoglycerate dehydrogenase [Anaerolineales bacterium]|nr:phosphoglycerate dehydrogenase [Anaerolineales bacterium]
MSYKVLISAPYLQPHLDRFRPIFAANDIELFVPPVEERFEEEDLLLWMGDIDGVICGDDRFTERVLEASPRLKVISKWGTGIDSIDKAACQRLGIALCNTPNAFSEPVADTVFGYMLAFVRRQPWMDRAMKGGTWQKINGRSLRECTLGIIGVGDVGKAVARRAPAFGLRLLGHDLVDMPAEFIAETSIEMVSREELLRQADFVSVNCDLNPTSYHLMNDSTLALMKPEAVLINTARGPIVEEAALIRALQSGQIGGAALDVFEFEPLPADSPLRQMDNVLLAPHNANSSPLAWERVHENSINNLLRELYR